MNHSDGRRFVWGRSLFAAAVVVLLVTVGLFRLLGGAGVRLAGVDHERAVRVFRMSVAVVGVVNFEFCGEVARLDLIFCWRDSTAFALRPTLQLHAPPELPEQPAA